MKRVAVFLDAGYFWVQLCNILTNSYSSRGQLNIDYEKLRISMLAEITQQFGTDCALLRVYWYDGPGVNGIKTSEHRAIDTLDDFKLRLGTRNGAGTQKGVDGLIIADMISLTQQKAITHALLVSGDSDITPGVIAAQSMGLRAHLLSLGSAVATSPYLAAEADFKRSWGLPEITVFAAVAAAPAPAATAIAPAATPAVATLAAPASVAVTISVAGPAPVAKTAAELEPIAQAAYQDIHAGALSAQLAAVAGITGAVPADIDKRLLYLARSSLGRPLLEPEKRILRTEFRKLL